MMVKRLLELRSALEDTDNPAILLSEMQWKQGTELEELFFSI